MSDEESGFLSVNEDGEKSLKSLNGSSSISNVNDYRFSWIWDRIMKFFLLDSSQKHLFDNLLNENDCCVSNKLTEFFNSELFGEMDLEKKVIFFYRTYRKEVIQEEISVWEESHAIKIPTSISSKGRSQRLTKSAPGKVEKGEEEKSRKGKKKKIIKESKSDENSIASSNIFTGVSANVHIDINNEADDEGSSIQEDDEKVIEAKDLLSLQKTKTHSKSSSLFAPPPGEENKYVLTKKIVDKEMELPALHIIFGQLSTNDGTNENVNYIYFLRTSEISVPIFNTQEECNDNITNYLIMGSLNGSLLETLNNMLLYVFKPLAEKQYRGISGIPQVIKEQEDKNIIESRNTIESRATEYSKTSSYHKLATPQDKLIDCAVSDHKIDQNNIQLDDKNKKSPVDSNKMKLLEYLDKLIASVGWTLKHVEGDVLLQLPKLTEITSMDLASDLSKLDETKIEQLEEVILGWEKYIDTVLDTLIHKVPEGNGPLAEYNYWHDRETSLSMLVEQLNIPIVKKILSSNEINSSVTSAFHWYEIELWKLYTEARNNNKCLLTALRYFELMDQSVDFENISEIIPLLMERMRMIWILSKYYNSEERMTALLERVAWQLCENVKKNLSIKELFSKPLDEILSQTKNAHTMTNNWRTSYLKTRETIELTEKGARWEFNQSQLFKKTDYIANVCDDLNKIASVLEDFHNIFGVELKAIISDPIQIDTIIKKVDELIIPIQNSDFNIFTEFNKENWDATMVWFYLEVSSLENEAKFLIDDCFTILISAEQALQLLLKFKNIKTRQAIQECLLTKFDVVMRQFCSEMNEIELIFNLGKKHPPLLKYHAPIVGAIFWERQLFHKLQKAINAFRNVQEFNNDQLRSLAFSQYFRITQHIEEFEKSKYSFWMENAELLVKNIMRKKILRTITAEYSKLTGDEHIMARVVNTMKKTKEGPRLKLPPLKSTSGSRSIYFDKIKLDKMGAKSSIKSMHADDKTLKVSDTSSLIEGASRQTKVTLVEPVDDRIMGEKQLSFEVNFDRRVLEVVNEAQMLELLGFDIPIAIRDVCIQKDRLKADIDAVQTMIDQYSEIMDKLDAADIRLLMKDVKKTEKYINSGVTRLNWSSLGILDYSANSKKLVKSLKSSVNQLHLMKSNLDDLIINKISCYNLCTTTIDPNSPKYELALCKTFFLDIEAKRSDLVYEMLEAYHSIGPMLLKMENLVEGTSTQKSEAMQNFYKDYETKMFTALITCFARNLEILDNSLNANKTMFLAEAVLLSSEVILRPSPNEISSIILHDVKDLLEKSKLFPRWIAGSCLECKPIKNINNDGSTLFSFFEDIMSVQIINDRLRNIHETTQKLTIESWRYIYRWKRYSNLWRSEKLQICEKFAALNPTLSQYDEKFTFYDTILEETEAMTPYYDIFSIRIYLAPLIKNIKQHVNEWKQIFGNFLLSQVQHLMKSLQSKIQKFQSEIELVITGLSRFKTVMQSIANVKNMTIQAEVEYNEYQETFSTLKAHDIAYSEEDEAQAFKLQQDWQSVYFGALFRSFTLSSTKEHFCEMSKDQISGFLKECEEFVDYFKKEGPGSVGSDLDVGLQKMEECEKLITNLDERQEELTMAERLFDLNPTDYSIFTEVKKEFDDMKSIYSLYRKQKDARDTWSKMLWADLNPQQLIDGMEYYIREFRDFPQTAQQLRIGQALELTMKSFQNSVPLFVELKNEAMRERHWTELMNKTKQSVDMSSRKFEET